VRIPLVLLRHLLLLQGPDLLPYLLAALLRGQEAGLPEPLLHLPTLLRHHAHHLLHVPRQYVRLLLVLLQVLGLARAV